MIRRLGVFATLVVGAACSQRAPWHVVRASAPMAGSTEAAKSDTAAAAAPAAALTKLPLATVARAEPSGAAVAIAVVPAVDAMAVAHLRSLLFPVGGVNSMKLDDSFDAPRDGGARKHNAIDIMAPRGTPILAVSDGRILRLAKSAKGGLSLYASDLEDRFVYYYAHLDRYHSRVYSGKPLLRGDTLGFVGTTGNAPKNLPHLHFQVMHMPADHKFWVGSPINPYPLLRQSASGDG